MKGATALVWSAIAFALGCGGAPADVAGSTETTIPAGNTPLPGAPGSGGKAGTDGPSSSGGAPSSSGGAPSSSSSSSGGAPSSSSSSSGGASSSGAVPSQGCVTAPGPDGYHLPSCTMTPGALCTTTDPNYDGKAYAEQVPHCARNVPTALKAQVAAAYGNIPQSSWSNYEFDHYIPLCVGGSDDIKNLWPQPIADAQKKDVVENDVCAKLRAGTMTQAQAIATIRAWAP